MESKKIDIQKDYLMYMIMNNLRSEIFTLTTRMQEVTPYGDAYIAAIKKYKEVLALVEAWESLLAECAEIGAKKGDI